MLTNTREPSYGYKCAALFLRFLIKYHINHVMIKMGRMSAPGTNSNKDMIPTQRNIARQAIIPTMSRISPTMVTSRTTTTYSLTSNNTHIMRKINSSSVKTKYLGKDFNPSPRFFKCLSSGLHCLIFQLFLGTCSSSWRPRTPFSFI